MDFVEINKLRQGGGRNMRFFEKEKLDETISLFCLYLE
jgi:hypothetical protein